MIELIPRQNAMMNAPDEVTKLVSERLTRLVKEQLGLNLNTALRGETQIMGDIFGGMQVTLEESMTPMQELSLYGTVEQTVVSLMNTRYVEILDSAIKEVNLMHPEFK